MTIIRRCVFAAGVAIACVFVFSIFSAPRAHAETSVGCQQDIPFEHDTFTNSIFGPTEQVEYQNGFLVIHFQFMHPLTFDEHWYPDFTYIDDQCRVRVTTPNGELSLFHYALGNVSIRFDSKTHYQFWDDALDTPLTCIRCSGTIENVGGFFKIRVRSTVYVSGSPVTLSGQIISSAHSTTENPSPPPVVSQTLLATPGCPVFSIINGIVDDYEHAEYVDGLLRIHFRRDPFQSVSDATLKLTSYNASCQQTSATNANFFFVPSSFTEYFSIRFTDTSHYDMWNDDLEQKMVCTDHCSGVFWAPPTDGFITAGMWQNYLLPNSSFTSTAFRIAERRDPVIIIPGILGSWEKNGQWVIDPVLHTYDNLISNLDGNGYTPGVDLFTFPYQWRDSNTVTAQLLKQKIADVKTICHCSKVDLVAHSMGGLVARQYIQSADYASDVDQLIFLGTPHEGSQKAYLSWEGATFPNDFESNLLKFYFRYEALKNYYFNLFDYIHNRPIVSLQELLPTTNYLRDDGTSILRSYPSNYPRNIFLENLKNTGDRLASSDVRVINIVGDVGASSTISEYRVVDSPKSGLWEHGYPKDYDSAPEHGIVQGAGDGTVTLESATAIAAPDTRITTYWHRDLVTKAEDQVIGALTPQRPLVLIDKGIIANMLYTKIMSPIDVQIIAPDGKRIGKDFATGQEINEIPDAFYSGFLTDDEYIAIPNPLDGEYKVLTQGTGTGEYTVATGFFTASTSAEQDFTGDTVPNATNELDVTINNSQPGQISIEPADTTPPSIAITSPTAATYARSAMLSITAAITDLSGVARTNYFFDGTPVSASVDLFYQKLGAHTVMIVATDTVNNTATVSASFTEIATFDSSISDTNRTFDLGWIKTKNIKNSIINKFETARDNTRQRVRTLTSLSEYLDTQFKKKTINQQAYDLLKEDVAWLQTH